MFEDDYYINQLFIISTFKNDIIYTPKNSNNEQLKSKLDYYKEKHLKACQENKQLLQCYLSDLIFELEFKIRNHKELQQ